MAGRPPHADRVDEVGAVEVIALEGSADDRQGLVGYVGILLVA